MAKDLWDVNRGKVPPLQMGRIRKKRASQQSCGVTLFLGHTGGDALLFSGKRAV